MKNLNADRIYELQKMAIDVMHKSIAEPRDDKVSPKVGAVLLKPNGDIETAARGELRYGDHAEFTLLERKNRDSNLDGGILFATLEPCAPGARRHPKLGCAERIVNARISEVWIGIEDPDPTVNRKGIKYLQKHNIQVHMFPSELQKQINQANKEFLEGANNRANQAKKKEKIILSELENQLPEINTDDFSKEAISYYLSEAELDFKPFSNAMYKHFENLELIKRQKVGNSFVYHPTGFGLLLFGNDPRERFQNAVIKTKVKYGNDQPIPKDFEGPLVLLPNEIESWLKKVLHSTINRDNFKRVEQSVFPIAPLREAIINALVHRDYDIKSAKTTIYIDDNKIEIRSAGLPVSPIELNDVLNFNAPSLSRNPKITYVFNKMGLMEEGELGMDTFKSMQEKYGLPLPSFKYKKPFLSLTFYRNINSLREERINSILEFDSNLNDEELIGLDWLRIQREVSSDDYAKHFGFSQKKAQRQLRKLVENNFVRLEGRGRSATYIYENKGQ